MVGRLPKPSDIDDLPTVKRWIMQLGTSKVVHNTTGQYVGTRGSYRLHLIKFNSWLVGQEFDVRRKSFHEGKMERVNVHTMFAHIEELMNFGADENVMDVKQIVSLFLSDPCHAHLSQSTMSIMASAIKSYFGMYDVEFAIKFNKLGKKATEVTEKPGMTLYDFYKMLTFGKVTPVARAMLLVKLHAALDVGTLMDRFNYYGYKQIAEFCGTKNHREWDLDKCPIPIGMVRVKTGYEHTTFIDRDALEAVKNYLAWREKTHGPHDPDGPMFFSKWNRPITENTVNDAFAKLAKEAGVQKQLAPRVLKIVSHEVRDLMKSTLLMCGCAPWAADHVLGHVPKDSYEKPAKIYPDELRKEYSKVSKVLNMFSYVEDQLKNIEKSDAMRDKEKKQLEMIEGLREGRRKALERLKSAGAQNRETGKENRKLTIESEKKDIEIIKLERRLLAADGLATGVKEQAKEMVEQIIPVVVEKAIRELKKSDWAPKVRAS